MALVVSNLIAARLATTV